MRRFLELLVKLHPIVTLFMALFFILGFGMETPQKKFKAINTEIVGIHEQVDGYGRILRGIAIGECLDRSERELQLMGLPCDSLLQTHRR